jgi:hypothetical protein
MDKQRPGHRESRRARDEAAALLGLSVPKSEVSLPTHPFAK